MKRTFKTSMTALLLAVLLALVLCACGKTKPAEEAAPTAPAAETAESAEKPEETDASAFDAALAGDYVFYCVYLTPEYVSKTAADGRTPAADARPAYVDYPQAAGQMVQLSDDGTGYLKWGEGNEGPIDAWKSEGETFSFTAGVSEMSGTIKNGLMSVALDDGFELCFLLQGAEDPKLELISMADYTNQVFPAETAEEPAEEETAATATAAEEKTETETAAATETETKTESEAASTQETAPAPEPAPAVVWTPEGEYSIFCADPGQGANYDFVGVMESTVSLREDGTGYFTFDGDGMDITSWTFENEIITITMADGGTASGAYKDGTFLLDLYGDGTMKIGYTQEGADTTSYNVQPMPTNDSGE